jgi:two-component system LytT family response regulator
VRAFEVHALDYLLKPFGAARLAQAVERARAELARRGHRPGLDPGLERLLAGLRDRGPRPERLAVRSGGRIAFIEIRAIDWVEAAGKHVRLHAGARTHLLRRTMDQMLRLLDPTRFARVHRSAIVQVDRIAEAEAAFHGDFRLRLRDGTELTLSRSYRRRLEEALGQEL